MCIEDVQLLLKVQSMLQLERAFLYGMQFFGIIRAISSDRERRKRKEEHGRNYRAKSRPSRELRECFDFRPPERALRCSRSSE